MRKIAIDQLELEGDLRRVFANPDFIGTELGVVFQPIVSLQGFVFSKPLKCIVPCALLARNRKIFNPILEWMII